MDSLLSTGDVAKLCGVTPDAVLKWIKKGKMPATRTPGGHYRISRECCIALGFGVSKREERSPAVSRGAERRSRLRCWEYFGQPGTPPDTCPDCLVFQARVEHCYKLAELGEQAGHKCKFCRTACIDCPFYRACNGLATIVLVITCDEALTRRLRKRIDARRVSLHFARTGYESSTLVGMLRPAVVILDGDHPETSEGKLVDSILEDDRIPGVKVLVAQERRGDSAVAGTVAVPTMAPFTAERL
ncbi:MAG: helix-turn-helix domain-containing protein, partial [Gemmatimonadales bacterium]